MSVESFKELVDKFNLYIEAIEAQFQLINTEIVQKTRKESIVIQSVSDDELREYVKLAKTARENAYKIYSIIEDFVHYPELALAWRKQYRSHKAENPDKELKPKTEPETLSSLVSGLNQKDLDKLLQKFKT